MIEKTYPQGLPAIKPIPDTAIPTPAQATKGQRFPFSNVEACGASASAANARSRPNTMLNPPNSRISIGLCQKDEPLAGPVDSKSPPTKPDPLLRGHKKLDSGGCRDQAEFSSFFLRFLQTGPDTPPTVSGTRSPSCLLADL